MHARAHVCVYGAKEWERWGFIKTGVYWLREFPSFGFVLICSSVVSFILFLSLCRYVFINWKLDLQAWLVLVFNIFGKNAIVSSTYFILYHTRRHIMNVRLFLPSVLSSLIIWMRWWLPNLSPVKVHFFPLWLVTKLLKGDLQISFSPTNSNFSVLVIKSGIHWWALGWIISWVGHFKPISVLINVYNYVVISWTL